MVYAAFASEAGWQGLGPTGNERMTLVMKEGLKEGTTFHFTVSPMVCFKLRLLGYRPAGHGI
jgi:hypothetical protein